jgi:hypothetical protein
MSVRDCMARVDAAEFIGWRAQYARKPWGPERDDLRTALSISFNAASHGGKIAVNNVLSLFDCDKEAPAPEAKRDMQAQSLRAFLVGLSAISAATAHKR